MNSEDRGIIKWQPFNSCFNSEQVIKDIKASKNIISFPTLSEDQLNAISEEISLAYNLKIIVKFEYFYAGKIKTITGIIEKLNLQEKKLSINKVFIYFKQILEIKEI